MCVPFPGGAVSKAKEGSAPGIHGLRTLPGIAGVDPGRLYRLYYY